MRKEVYLVMILAALLAVGCGNMTKGKSAAQSQVTVFYQRFNDQDLEAIVAAAHPDLLKKSPKSEVINFLSVVRRKLGKVTNSENVNWNVRTFNLVTTVVIVQNTTFETGKGTETFTFRIRKETASLLGYNINSQYLIMK
jgi:PBP1b-binding outer membrane lipoprotein LpoB